MKKEIDVYGIGNAIVDLQVSVGEEAIVELGLEKAGMKLVSEEEQAKIIDYLGLDFTNIASGGSGANSVILMSQLGSRVAYGCLVGDDHFGLHYSREMKELGVKLHNKNAAGATTGSSVILITPDAERTMNTFLGVSAQFDAHYVSAECVAQSQWIYLEGYLASSMLGQAALRRAIELAKEHGTKIAFTFSDGFIVDVFGEMAREVVASSELIFANLNEALRFTGAADEAAAFARLKELVPNFVMTLSERGARIWYGQQEYRVEPFSIRAVDDTGAGDAFAGGFLHGLCNGLSPADAGQLACFLAGQVVAQLGPRLKSDPKALVAAAEGLSADVRHLVQAGIK